MRLKNIKPKGVQQKTIICITEIVMMLGIGALVFANVLSIFAAIVWAVFITVYYLVAIEREAYSISKVPHIILLLFLAYSTECSMQLMIEHGYKITFSYQRIIDFFVYVIIFLMFGQVCKRKTTGLIICRILFYCVENLNFVVTFYRGKPVYFPDIFSTNTALDVAGGYTFPRSKVWLICATIFLINIACIIWIRNKEIDVNNKLSSRLLKIASVLIIPLVIVLFQIPTKLQWRGYYFATTEYWLYSFAMSAYQMNIEEPENYNEESIPIDKKSDYIEVDLEDTPNVIFIMNESFADLRVISEFNESEQVMPFYDRIVDDRMATNGKLYTSIYGGNTANTEFEVLTGISMHFLPYDTTSYNLYVKNDTYSLATYFSDLGYRTIAFHPSAKSNYYREEVYPNLGFRESYFQEDYKKELDFLRGFTSDVSNYEKVIEFFEEKNENEKLFFFNVTVQNHGPFDREDDEFENKISLGNDQFHVTEQYLSCLRYSDEALEMLIEYFKEYNEPVAIVFFGDHQPKIDIEFYEQLYGKEMKDLTKEEEGKKYIVPYMIWTNYGAELEQSEKDISANYLGAYAIEQLGFPQTAFYKYLNNLKNEYPIITAQSVSDGKIYIDERMKLEEYESISYNLLFDKENEWKSIYQLKNSCNKKKYLK